MSARYPIAASHFNFDTMPANSPRLTTMLRQGGGLQLSALDQLELDDWIIFYLELERRAGPQHTTDRTETGGDGAYVRHLV